MNLPGISKRCGGLIVGRSKSLRARYARTTPLGVERSRVNGAPAS
jgi:hypothetical protein